MLDAEIEKEGLNYELVLRNSNSQTDGTPLQGQGYKKSRPPGDLSPKSLRWATHGDILGSMRSGGLGMKSPSKNPGSVMGPTKLSTSNKMASLRMKGVRIPTTFIHNFQPLSSPRDDLNSKEPYPGITRSNTQKPIKNTGPSSPLRRKDSDVVMPRKVSVKNRLGRANLYAAKEHKGVNT
jgi:hypothetical protein